MSVTANVEVVAAGMLMYPWRYWRDEYTLWYVPPLDAHWSAMIPADKTLKVEVRNK